MGKKYYYLFKCMRNGCDVPDPCRFIVIYDDPDIKPNAAIEIMCPSDFSKQYFRRGRKRILKESIELK